MWVYLILRKIFLTHYSNTEAFFQAYLWAVWWTLSFGRSVPFVVFMEWQTSDYFKTKCYLLFGLKGPRASLDNLTNVTRVIYHKNIPLEKLQMLYLLMVQFLWYIQFVLYWSNCWSGDTSGPFNQKVGNRRCILWSL